MKIKKSVLTEFLKKCLMEDTQEIQETILRFESDGLKISANSPPKQARVMGWLLKGAFKEYEELGNVGVNDFGTIIKVLDRFGDEIILTKEGNLLTVKGARKSVDIELVSENFIETDTTDPELEFTETFNTTASALKDIFKDVKMNKDAVMKWTTEEKKVKITNTGKFKFKNELEAPSCKGGTTVKFGEPLIHATNKLDGNLEISVATDYPMKVREKTDTSIITLIIAPRVEDE